MNRNNSTKSKHIFLMVSLLGLIVLSFSLYLYQSFKIDHLMGELHQLHLKKKQLLNETENLQAEVDRLSSVDKIVPAAKNMGLEFSDETTLVIRIEDLNDLDKLKTEFAKRNDKIEEKIKTAGM